MPVCTYRGLLHLTVRSLAADDVKVKLSLFEGVECVMVNPRSVASLSMKSIRMSGRSGNGGDGSLVFTFTLDPLGRGPRVAHAEGCSRTRIRGGDEQLGEMM